jgi:hypothetical protein
MLEVMDPSGLLDSPVLLLPGSPNPMRVPGSVVLAMSGKKFDPK